MIDSKGVPIAWNFSKAAEHDNKYAKPVIEEALKLGYKPKRIGLDKGYDDIELRHWLLNNKGIIPIIPYRKNVKIRDYEDIYIDQKKYCRQRWKVERNFAHKDNSNRRIEHFYEKSIEAYSRLYLIAVIRFYLKRFKSLLN